MRRPPPWLVHPLALFAGSRLVTLPAFGVSMLLAPGGGIAKVLRQWDGGWYLNLAANGSPRHVPMTFGPEAQTTIAFFPLFPALARAVSTVTGLGLEASAMVVVLLCGAAASVALWSLVARLRDDATADATVALFVFFPGTIALSMVYSEALAVALVIGCCWALLERRWVIAGILGALATATRPNTGAVVLAAAVAAAIEVRRHGNWRSLAAPLLAPLGAIGYLGFLWWWTGDAMAWGDTQWHGWHERFVPHQSALDVFHYVRGRFHDVSLMVVVLTILFAILAAVLVLTSDMPAVLRVFAVGTLAIGMTSAGLRPRFVLLAFPVFLALADRLDRTSLLVVVGGSAVLLGSYCVLMSTPFYPSP